MQGKDALAQALVWLVEGRPVIQAVSTSHGRKEDDWVIVEKIDGEYVTTHEIPEPVDG